VVPAHGDAIDLDDDDDENDDDYDNDASGDDADEDDDDPEGAGAPLDEEENAESRKNRLLRGVVRTNDDYGLGAFVPLPDPSPEAPAVFETVELQAPVFFLSRSLVRAGGFTDVDPPICARCLRWNLVAPFSKCNRDGLAGCGRCTYIQHARCKDVGPWTLPGPCPTANRDRCRRSFCRPSL
jgi:hypothetical protein